MKKIVLFASGSGSNVENIILYFKSNSVIEVTGVFCNNPSAKVIDRALQYQIPVIVFSKEELNNDFVLAKLLEFQPDIIVLAGFLWRLPTSIIENFPNKIINIHPALLPKYGGKGMYGMNVHAAVIENRDSETGITIHHVNENYDEGNIIFQESIKIDDCKSPEEIASRIRKLEQKRFPAIIEKFLIPKS